jgi:hypothetical protein
MLRRMGAIIALAVMIVAIAAPLIASAHATCAMCGKTCCCPPMKSGGRTSINRACDAAASSEAASTSQGAFRIGLLQNAVVVPEAAASGYVHATQSSQPVRRAQDPPDHPPRLSR